MSDEEIAEFETVFQSCARALAEACDRMPDEGDSEDVDEQ